MPLRRTIGRRSAFLDTLLSRNDVLLIMMPPPERRTLVIEVNALHGQYCGDIPV